MKVRYINEGLFGTKAQMQKKLEKEDSLSDEEIISKEANEVLCSRINRYLTNLIRDEELTPFPRSIFYTRVGNSRTSRTVNVTIEKAYAYCKIATKARGKNEIHISLDCGQFMANDEFTPCDNLTIGSVNALNPQALDSVKEAFLKSVSKKEAGVIFCNRLKRVMKNRGCSKFDEHIYNMIMNSKLVLDEILMYGGSSLKELPIWTPVEYLGNPNYEKDVQEILSMYKQYIDNFMEFITFQVPVTFNIPRHVTVNNESMLLISELGAGDTLAELEKKVGVDYFLETEADYLLTSSHTRVMSKIADQVIDFISNSKYMTGPRFIVTYSGKYDTANGFQVDGIKDLAISRVAFSSAQSFDINKSDNYLETYLHIDQDKEKIITFQPEVHRKNFRPVDVIAGYRHQNSEKYKSFSRLLAFITDAVKNKFLGQ